MSPQSQSTQAGQSAAPAVSDLRIAVVSDAAPERNGVGAYYRDLIDCLLPRVAAARIFSPVIEDGVWRAGLVFPMPSDETQRLCVPNPFSLRRELDRLQPHVVIIPTPGVYGMAGAFMASRAGFPVIASFHTSFEHLSELYWQGSLTGRIFTGYLEKTNSYLFRLSRRIIVNSDDMYDIAKKMGGEHVRRVGTPVPVAFSREPVTPHKGSLEKIIFAGRLAAEKHIESVIALAEAMPGISVSVVGDGQQRGVVEAAAARLPNFAYLGWLSREALRDEIDRHDMLVLPSHFESFGTIALEAMSRQRLVAVSRGCGISNWPELTESLFVFGEGESLTDAVGRASKLSTEQRRVLARSGHEAAAAFDQRNLEDWENLLVEVGSGG